MYNILVKNEFISSVSASSRKKYKELFSTTVDHETKLKKDLSNFSGQEFVDLFYGLNLNNSNEARKIIRLVKKYADIQTGNTCLNGLTVKVFDQDKKPDGIYRLADTVKELALPDSEVVAMYDAQINPSYVTVMDKNNKKKNNAINTRANKNVRYSHYHRRFTATLEEKERWAIDLLKIGLARASKPVVSCSFGIDSIVSVYLTRKALQELGRDPSDIDIAWNDTANEFQDVRRYQKQITKDWNLKLQISKPERTLKHIIDKNGGVTEEYFFARKGDRRNNKQQLSEKCCGTLKHKPMKKMIASNSWNFVVVGLRFDESRQRLFAGLRDGEYFYSTAEWKAFICRPILWWTEEELWKYIEKENIPFNDLYDKNLIQAYPTNHEKVIEQHQEMMISLGLDIEALLSKEASVVTKKQSLFLEKLKFKVFTPRTGCMMCPIPVKYGYMEWMRTYYPKVYDAMVYTLGYGKVLMEMKGVDMSGVPDGQENEYIKEVLDYRPCTFDKFTK